MRTGGTTWRDGPSCATNLALFSSHAAALLIDSQAPMSAVQLLGTFEVMWFRLQGAAAFLLRIGPKLEVFATDSHEKARTTENKIARGRARFHADITVYAQLVEETCAVPCLKPVLHFAVCKFMFQMAKRGHPHNENWMEQLMGRMKKGAR